MQKRNTARRNATLVVALAAFVVGGGAFGASRLMARNAKPTMIVRKPMSSAQQLRERDLQIRAWKQALDGDSVSAIALGQLAALHLQRGRETGTYEDFATAEAYARRSLSLRTQRNGMTYVTLASSLLAQHRFADARAVATTLVAAEPDTPEYRALLGETQLELGDYTSARESFGSVWINRTSLSIAPRLARWEEVSGRTAVARELLTAARESALARGNLPPEQLAWFHLRLAEVDMRAGKLRSARRAIDEGLKLVPDDFRLLGARARIEAASGRPDRAIEYGERSISIRMDPVVLGVLSDAYAARGDSAKAAEYATAMQMVVAAQPGPFHRAWALFLLDHGRSTADVLVRAQAELQQRRDIYGCDIVAWALYREHRYQEASDASKCALQLGTSDATLYYHAGMIQVALHNNEAARAHLQHALDINSSFDATGAREARTELKSLKRGAKRSTSNEAQP